MQQPIHHENQPTPSVLVTGGTGLLGRHVTPLLQAAGFRTRVLSRHEHESTDGVEYVKGDLVKGEGIEAAVAGIATILHLSGGANAKGDDEATRKLMSAASRAGVRHVVCISVVGADRIPLGYLKTKLAVEQAVTDSGVPSTTVRVAQVDDLVLTMTKAMGKLPVVPAPGGLRLQPIDARDVAARLAELTVGEPSGRVADLVGPNVYTLRELVEGYLRTRGKRRMMLPIRIPGKAGRAYRAGENLALEGATVGRRTWEDFLADRSASDATATAR
jgi:uncharacterized protein YbjT (DUF2867 family)